MKIRKRIFVKVTFVVSIMFFCSVKIQAQVLDCGNKGYFFFKAYDSYHRILYISNIIKGDAYWCVDGKKRYADDKKVDIFRKARKLAEPKGNPPSDDIFPNNSGRSPRNGELLANDYNSVKKEYDIEINRTKSPDKIVKGTIDEKEFQ